MNKSSFSSDSDSPVTPGQEFQRFQGRVTHLQLLPAWDGVDMELVLMKGKTVGERTPGSSIGHDRNQELHLQFYIKKIILSFFARKKGDKLKWNV